MKKNSLKLTRSKLSESIFYLNGSPFSLSDYPHMRLIYDITPKNLVLKFSRQCVHEDQIINLADGRPVRAKDLQPGQEVIGFDPETGKNKVCKIAKIWDNGIQDTYEIKTRFNSVAVVTDNHPFRKIDKWCQAKSLKIKDFIATSKDNTCALPEKPIEESYDAEARLFFRVDRVLKDREFPEWVWRLNEYQLKDFLRIAWNEIGYNKLNRMGNSTIGMYHHDDAFLKVIRSLLLKVSIFSTIAWDNGLSCWRLVVSDTKSKKRFVNEIHTFKNEGSDIAEGRADQHLQVDPNFVVKHLNRLPSSARIKHRMLRETTRREFAFESLEIMNNLHEIPAFHSFINGDIFFDRVEEKNYLGKKQSIGIEIDDLHTFQIDGLITKNTSKSTTIANLMIADAITRPKDPTKGGARGFQQLYISPTVDQSKIFSNDRLTPVIEGSPWIKKHYLDTKINQNVFMKRLKNEAKLYVRYALLNADRIRGMSVDKIYWDESQDILESLMPVAEQAMSRSYYKERVLSGTPKLTQGTLAKAWFRSTMNEYVLKCEHCSKWNIPNEDNIGLNGLICKHCGKGLNPKNGQWVRTGPSANDKYDIEGFRVCALHFYGAPWINWKKDILLPYETQPPNIFFNEILGLEYDDGVNPLTEHDVRACCTGGPMLERPDNRCRSNTTFLGVDYGPINSADSYTVAVALQREGPRIRILGAKRYEGKEADFAFIHQDLVDQVNLWGAKCIGADHGMGEASNSELRKTLGPHRVVAFQHQANQKEEIKWNGKLNAYMLARTQIMTRFFSDIRNGKFIFPQWEDWEPFAKDLLAPVVDYNKDKTKMFYVNNNPDDIFHAIIYGTTCLELLESMIDW